MGDRGATRFLPLAIGLGLVGLVSGSAPLGSAADELPMPPERWQVVTRESGPVNYYTIVGDPSGTYIHAQYRPPAATTVLGFDVQDGARKRGRGLRWSWRAMTLPLGGDECQPGKGDSAAVVYVTWKKFLRWYTLKYVWSTVGPKGAVCDRKRNPFVAQDTVVLESGPPLGEWRVEEVDLKSEFRRHFSGGRADADVPDLVGIGIMSDGDQTRSESAADYRGFVLVF